MKPGLKATLILVTTLVLGIVIGYIGHSTWHHFAHQRRADRLPRDAGFVARMERILRPDSLQVDAVRAVLENHEVRFKEARARQTAAMEMLMDSLLADLRGMVPEEGIERLERIRERGLMGRGRRPRGERAP